MKTFLGTITKQGINWNNEFGIQDLCKKYEGRKVHMQLIENNRTPTQNNFYWVYLGVIEAETGNLADDIHEYAKRKFLPPKFIKINGNEIKIPGSTTELTKHEFSEYMDKLCAWSGVAIPNPEELGYARSF